MGVVVSNSVTVIIPAYNAAGTIAEAVRAVLSQSVAPSAVIVVDDGCTDETSRVVQAMTPAVSVISQPNAGPAAARNAGILAAATPFIAFTDSDCVPDPIWLADLLNEFDCPQVAGAGGRVCWIGSGLLNRYADWIRLLQPVVDGNGAVEFLITANAMFRRDALLSVGLFSPRFRKPGGEDPDLCKRLRAKGYQLRAAPGGVVQHHHRSSLGRFLRTAANYGEGRFLLAAEHPEYALPGEPGPALLKHLLAVRPVVRRVRHFRRDLGIPTSALFSVLEYLETAATLYGYFRRSGAARKTNAQ